MALARIISRSHPCSRVLALDLLARGYAVEIVSPDSIPDNFADLELRVEEDPGNRLVASVEAHNGGRSASLEFVHHLKAPMVDFVRRPPEPHEAVHSPEEPVSFNAEHGAEDVELHAEQRASEGVSPAAEIRHDPELNPELNPELSQDDGACLISPLDSLPSLPVEPQSHFAVEAEAPTIARPTIARPIAQPTLLPTTVRSRLEPQRLDRSAGWFWRAAGLAFTSVVLLALVFGFGMRRTGEASAAHSSRAVPAEKVAAASIDVSLSRSPVPEKVPEKAPGQNPGKDSGQVSSLAVSPPAIPSDGNSNHASKKSRVATAIAPTTIAPTAIASTDSPRATVSLTHGDDSIAPDTVIYFDQRTFDEAASRANSSKHFEDRYPSSRKQSGGVIAANTVTPDDNPSPKPAKQDSALK
jgi:hypothetical protein